MSEGMKKGLKIAIPVLIGVVIAFIQPPDGLTQQAMIYMGIFECVVAWLMLGAVPDWAAFLACISAYVVFNVAKFGVVFAPFADSTVWLLIGAFGMTCALIKTGLVKRLAFGILSLFPESYKGQLTAFYVAGFAITPWIPAKIGKGVMVTPIAAAATKALGYPARSKAATGIFLAVWVTTGILGYAFLTGAAPVMITIGMLPADQQAGWTWMGWLGACAMWLVIVTVLSYIVLLALYGPKKGTSSASAGSAAGSSADAANADATAGVAATSESTVSAGEMSGAKESFAKKQSREEKLTAVLVLVAIVGWIFGSKIGLSAPIISVGVFAIMAVIGLVDTKDLTTGIPWDTAIFIGGILSLASLLTQLGISSWIATLMEPIAGPVVSNPYVYVIAVCVLTYIARLVVVSSTATQVIFLAALGGVASAAGINPFVTLFVCLASTAVWHLPFTNNEFIPLLGAQKGEMCEHSDTLPFNYAYMAINLVACLASVPVWQAMGLM